MISYTVDERLDTLQELVSKPKMYSKFHSSVYKSSIDVHNLPESLDWRTKGVITPVRDEGQQGEIVTAIVSTGKYLC